MPIYVFQMKGHACASERVEIRLESAAEARAHIVVAVGEMLRHRGDEFWTGPEWQVDVTDETGATLCTLTVLGRMEEALVSVQPAQAAIVAFA